MQKLAKREEEMMQVLWRLERAFVKDIIAELAKPKPHYNSVSTIVRNLEEKGFVDHEALGNSFRYFPLISKETYQRQTLKDIVKHYFNDSYSNMLTFFAREEQISEADLQRIVHLIQSKKS
jgi:BlaI family penicillinase repressor